AADSGRDDHGFMERCVGKNCVVCHRHSWPMHVQNSSSQGGADVGYLHGGERVGAAERLCTVCESQRDGKRHEYVSHDGQAIASITKFAIDGEVSCGASCCGHIDTAAMSVRVARQCERAKTSRARD